MNKPAPNKPTGSRRNEKSVSLYPLTPEQAISNIFKISKTDVKRILATRPGKKRKR